MSEPRWWGSESSKAPDGYPASEMPGSSPPVVEMGRCRDCRWWMGDDQPRAAVCIKVRPIRDSAVPMLAGYGVGIASLDDSPSLYTAPDFGCVQWAAREGGV